MPTVIVYKYVTEMYEGRLMPDLCVLIRRQADRYLISRSATRRYYAGAIRRIRVSAVRRYRVRGKYQVVAHAAPLPVSRQRDGYRRLDIQLEGEDGFAERQTLEQPSRE